jgi:tRNA (adenine37-N6)-methyltransferase
VVRAARTEPEDDNWGGSTAVIELAAGMDPTCLDGIEDFSHAEILYIFDRVPPEKIVTGSRHPRNNTAWPRVGIFAQRGKNRPNRTRRSCASSAAPTAASASPSSTRSRARP